MTARALLYYELHSRANRLRARLARLRQPKYLFGAIVGVGYFYWYAFGPWHKTGRPAWTPAQAALFESIAALGLLVAALAMWIVPHERAALAFTEAEVAFLFPAPVGRRALLNFKLIKSQFAILISSLILTLVLRRGGNHPFLWGAGWWIVLSNINLHMLGSSFARTMLLDRGISNWRRRLLFLGGAGLVATAVVVWAARSLPPPPDMADVRGGSDLFDYAGLFFSSGPVPGLLAPFRLVVAPMFATDAGKFLAALGPALGVTGLQYWWIIRSNVAFEEASVEMSRKFAERISAMRSGNYWQEAGKAGKAKRPPFELQPGGWPAVGIFWKNLIGAGYFFRGRRWFFFVWIFIVMGLVMRGRLGHSGTGEMISFAALMLLFMSLVSGPQLLRYDFRQDLRMADVLKTYPIPAWQVVLGEILAPAAILAVVQWLLILAAVLFATEGPHGVEIPVVTRISVGLAVALVLPFVDLIAVMAPNAAALVFPAWVHLGKDTPRGLETGGQQIILMFGQLLALALSVLPAAIAFGVVEMVLSRFFDPATAAVPAALAAAACLAMEAALGVWLLGRAFERFDWSEGTPE